MPRYGQVVFALSLAAGLSACSGAPHQGMLPAATDRTAATHTFNLPQMRGASATIVMRSNGAQPAVAFFDDRSGSAVSKQSLSTSCPAIPPIRITNPTSITFTIQISSLTIRLLCIPSSPLFGASFFQIAPLPTVVSPTKLGDASISGSTLTFTPAVHQLTLPAHTTSELVILPEQSTAEVALPVAPGSTTDLTANAPNVSSALSVTYQTASGGSLYSVSCFNAFTDGTLAQALQGVPLVGIPSFYCHLNPANGSTITFGNVVQFTIGLARPDRSIFEPDGSVQGFSCTDSNQCNVPQFTVPTTYQNFIAGNALDPSICVPATANVDCNNVSGDTQGGSLSAVSSRREFQVLVADDPTYKPGTVAAPVPWDGLFRMTLTGPCRLSTAADNENDDAPPKYSDANQSGVGPYAEFDITPTGTGTCSITAAEDTRYLIDDANPLDPKPRSASVSVTLQ